MHISQEKLLAMEGRHINTISIADAKSRVSLKVESASGDVKMMHLNMFI